MQEGTCTAVPIEGDGGVEDEGGGRGDGSTSVAVMTGGGVGGRINAKKNSADAKCMSLNSRLIPPGSRFPGIEKWHLHLVINNIQNLVGGFELGTGEQ
jgi:hypothetical protein